MTMIEFMRRLLYEGWMGMNVWFFIIAFFFLGLIYVNWQRLKIAFTPRYWKRRFVANHTRTITVEVSLPPIEEMDRDFLIDLNEAVVEGIQKYSDKYDVKDPSKELMRRR